MTSVELMDLSPLARFYVYLIAQLYSIFRNLRTIESDKVHYLHVHKGLLFHLIKMIIGALDIFMQRDSTAR